MERLWSLAVATGGNPWQMEAAENGSHKRKFVAVGCVQLPESFHGKGGSRRFESARGLCKSPANRQLVWRGNLHELQFAVGMEPLMELSGSERPQNATHETVRRRPGVAPPRLDPLEVGLECDLHRWVLPVDGECALDRADFSGRLCEK
jgi:hypothetical protein